MRVVSWALVGVLLSSTAAAPSAAQPASPSAASCRDTAPVSARVVSRQTQQASERAVALVRQAGADADMSAIRDRVLKDEFPAADVDVTLHRMLQEYCTVVLATGGADRDNRVARLQAVTNRMRKPVRGPAELARTRNRPRADNPSLGQEPVRLATAAVHLAHWTTGVAEPAQADATSDEFLRDPPPYVNDSNRYFVIVGSVPSESGAIRLMNRLKAKAPKYDFVVYMPYGSNPNYAIMMATWVSKAVATRALRAARAEVVPDAYLWACPSFGEGC